MALLGTAQAGLRGANRPRARRLGLDSWVWVAIIALTPVQQLVYVLVSSQIRIVPVIAAVVSLLLARVARPRFQTALTIAALLVVIAGPISGTNSDIGESFSVAVSFALLLGITPAALLFQIRRYPSFLRVAVTSTLVVQSASAAAGIAQLAGIPIFGVIARDGRVNGLAFHPNVLGVMSALAILILLDVLRRQWRGKWLVLIAIALNAVALAATASLSSLITLAAGLVFFVVRLRVPTRWLSITAISILILFAAFATGGNLMSLFPEAFSDRVAQVTGAVDSDVASLQVRFQTYEYALNYISHDPVIGVGMDPMNQGTVTPSLVVHDYILRGWYQGGVTLLIAFLIVTVTAVYVAVRGIRRTGLTAPSAVIVAMLAFGLTSAFYTQSHYWLPVLMSLAVLSARDPGRDSVQNGGSQHLGLSPIR